MTLEEIRRRARIGPGNTATYTPTPQQEAYHSNLQYQNWQQKRSQGHFKPSLEEYRNQNRYASMPARGTYRGTIGGRRSSGAGGGAGSEPEMAAGTTSAAPTAMDKLRMERGFAMPATASAREREVFGALSPTGRLTRSDVMQGAPSSLSSSQTRGAFRELGINQSQRAIESTQYGGALTPSQNFALQQSGGPQAASRSAPSTPPPAFSSGPGGPQPAQMPSMDSGGFLSPANNFAVQMERQARGAGGILSPAPQLSFMGGDNPNGLITADPDYWEAVARKDRMERINDPLDRGDSPNQFTTRVEGPQGFAEGVRYQDANVADFAPMGVAEVDVMGMPIQFPMQDVIAMTRQAQEPLEFPEPTISYRTGDRSAIRGPQTETDLDRRTRQSQIAGIGDRRSYDAAISRWNEKFIDEKRALEATNRRLDKPRTAQEINRLATVSAGRQPQLRERFPKPTEITRTPNRDVFSNLESMMNR